MKENLRMEKWKEEERRSGPVGTDLSVNGRMTFNMEQVYSIISKTRRSAKENGDSASAIAGFLPHNQLT